MDQNFSGAYSSPCPCHENTSLPPSATPTPPPWVSETPAAPSLPCVSLGTSSLLSPGLRRQYFLLLFLVVFVDFIDTLGFLHVVGQFPGFLSHTTPGRRHCRGIEEVVASTTKTQLYLARFPGVGFGPSPPQVQTRTSLSRQP